MVQAITRPIACCIASHPAPSALPFYAHILRLPSTLLINTTRATSTIDWEANGVLPRKPLPTETDHCRDPMVPYCGSSERPWCSFGVQSTYNQKMGVYFCKVYVPH
jgi:hypothetical protein